MPVKKLVRSGPSPTGQALLIRLVDEWQRPAQQPIIIEEGGGQGQPVQLYVVWDDWAPLRSIERSEVIMDAYEQVRGRAGTTNVSVAMGLTPIEAERLGIRYQ